MLWVDKYRPSSIQELSYHKDTVSAQLSALAANPASMPHLFFYGPTGSGKTTRISALLKALYGPGAARVKLDQRVITTPTKKTIEINMVSSNYHVELHPSDAGLNDRFVIQTVIKEMAANKNIASMNARGGPPFKTVVLQQVDHLSRQAQAALRRTMETYASTCRLILCCGESPAKVLEPVRSRCLGIRVPAPSEQEVSAMLSSSFT